MITESVMLSNHLLLCWPFLLLPSIFSSIRVFSNESALHIRWPNYWSFSFSSSPSTEYSGLISFRIDWFDLLAVHVTLKSLLQHHRLKASILWHSAFFMVQLSHPYMTIGKTISLSTLSKKWVSLLFNTLFRFVIFFLLRSKCLLSWLQSPFVVIFEPKKRKSVTASTFSLSICHKVMGLNAVILVFWMLSFKQFFHSSLSPSSRGSLVPLHFSAIRVLLFAYLRLLVFLPEILIPACDSSSLAFQMMYLPYKLNKQGDNIQPCHTPFPFEPVHCSV